MKLQGFSNSLNSILKCFSGPGVHVSSGVRSTDEQTMGRGSIMWAEGERKTRQELQIETREDRASGQAWGDAGGCSLWGRTRGPNWIKQRSCK